jgi:hypothetical protein
MTRGTPVFHQLGIFPPFKIDKEEAYRDTPVFPFLTLSIHPLIGG